MSKLAYFLFTALFLSLSSCKEHKPEKETPPITESTPNDLLVDHLNIWVKDPQQAKQRLVDLGFTSIPDSLSQIHKGQGTAGKYFNFLNCYLELIFVHDLNELDNNVAKNKDMDFAQRANFEQNGASPFSIALQVKDYDLEKIPFEKVRYRQDWMEENVYIYAAKNSKTHLQEPSFFVVYPEIEVKPFETLEDLKKIPEEDAIWREFFKHANGAKKVTRISITSTGIDLDTETIRPVNGIENLKITNGPEHFMELYFDDNIQGQSFDLRPDLPLKIYL